MLGMKAIPVAMVIKFFRPRIKLIVNIGGIEWERPQFNKVLKLYLRFCFYLVKKIANSIVVDNEFYKELFDDADIPRISNISYGGTIDNSLNKSDLLKSFSFLNSEYYLSVSRSIEDNKLEELCKMFSQIPNKRLVLISNFSNSDYGASIYSRYNKYSNLVLIDGLYNKPELDVIRKNCKAYIHTHTLCGSAPSLIEMIVCRVPIFSIDVIQNRYTLSSHGSYFKSFEELDVMINKGLIPNIPSLEFASNYDWKNVVRMYEGLT